MLYTSLISILLYIWCRMIIYCIIYCVFGWNSALSLVIFTGFALKFVYCWFSFTFCSFKLLSFCCYFTLFEMLFCFSMVCVWFKWYRIYFRVYYTNDCVTILWMHYQPTINIIIIMEVETITIHMSDMPLTSLLRARAFISKLVGSIGRIRPTGLSVGHLVNWSIGQSLNYPVNRPVIEPTVTASIDVQIAWFHGQLNNQSLENSVNWTNRHTPLIRASFDQYRFTSLVNKYINISILQYVSASVMRASN